ncbi:DUF3077 domain-containing protein [Zoogloea dura]|uniref:DUF3077 domain-containing protein n=1 Tax=Zoogloea dura TaxID=2728840 RepID=A0A848G0L0_9RHOO|nr:DUF3077 domain-containing protein [Zoogloea dura]NML24580.1 DUF3077 domain-containing protein [Zoogloea dura]
MSLPTHGTSAASTRVTALHHFFGISGYELFAVREGVLIADALQQAAHLMTSAVDAAYRTADEAGTPTAFAAAYLAETALGCVRAAADAIVREDQAIPSDPAGFLREAIEDSRQKASQARTAKMRTYHEGRVSAFQIAIAALEG